MPFFCVELWLGWEHVFSYFLFIFKCLNFEVSEAPFSCTAMVYLFIKCLQWYLLFNFLNWGERAKKRSHHLLDPYIIIFGGRRRELQGKKKALRLLPFHKWYSEMSLLNISCLAAPKHETVLKIIMYLRNNQHWPLQFAPQISRYLSLLLPLCSRCLGQGKV